MRDLERAEIDQVAGGMPLLAVPVIIGAATGGISGGIQSDGNLGNIAFGAAVGAAAGFFGTVAAVTTGVARVLYGGYAIAAGVVATWTDS